jgi:hypothetical protein
MDSLESADLTYWQQKILDQKASGQPIAIFCRERQLSRSKFYVWKKRLQPGKSADATAPQSMRFVPVLVQDSAEANEAHDARVAIEIRLRCGHSLVVAPGFAPDHLRAVLAVLEREA